MAIGDIPSSPPQAASPPQPIDIEAWTAQATVALGAVTITTPGDAVQGTSVTLAIPLDEDDVSSAVHPTGASAAAKEGVYYRRNDLLRRDSLKRRETLLKGREGSRRRQRWENGTWASPLPLLSETLYASQHLPPALCTI
jgi:hypothetical protein